MELRLMELTARSEKVVKSEQWRLKYTSDKIIIGEGVVDFSQCNHKVFNKHDIFISENPHVTFPEAFKEYIKGKTIAPESRAAEFNKNYDYKTQEPIENVTEDEINQMWIVLD